MYTPVPSLPIFNIEPNDNFTFPLVFDEYIPKDLLPTFIEPWLSTNKASFVYIPILGFWTEVELPISIIPWLTIEFIVVPIEFWYVWIPIDSLPDNIICLLDVKSTSVYIPLELSDVLSIIPPELITILCSGAWLLPIKIPVPSFPIFISPPLSIKSTFSKYTPIEEDALDTSIFDPEFNVTFATEEPEIVVSFLAYIPIFPVNTPVDTISPLWVISIPLLPYIGIVAGDVYGK